MKNNRLTYILIIILTIWCVALSVNAFSSNKNEVKQVVNNVEINGISTDLTNVVDAHKNSIVTINANGITSSGFVYSQVEDSIYVLTSYHGVADASSIYVGFANSLNLNANLVGKNLYADLAVLEVKSPYDVEPLKFADIVESKSGEFVISIGTPKSHDYSQSVELGMISNPRRTIENSITVDDVKTNYYIDVVQLSSNLIPGYSGSPIINMNGEVIGMNTMSLDDNINFAVTGNEIKIIADKIINNEPVKKYQLGIKGSYINEMPLFERSNLNLPVDVTNGLYIERLTDSAIGFATGLRNGDIILSINDISINNINDYLKVCYTQTDAFNFNIYRDGETLSIRIEIND